MTTLPPCCSPVAASVVALVLIVALASSTFVPLQTEPADWELKDDGLACKDHRTGNVDVLVAGVSRTSTSSMQQALQGLGYNTTHWLGYMTRYFEFISHFYVGRIKVPNLHKVFEDIPEKGALLDTVVPAMFDDLRRAYPKAKVILTTREGESWFTSYENYVAQCWLYHWTRYPLLFFLSHVSRAFRLGPLLRSFHLLGRPSGLDLDRLPELSEVFRLSDMVMYGSWKPNFWHVRNRKLYEQHVISTVPPEQLMIFDASAGDTIGKIARFLNVSTTMNPESYPRLFDKSKLASHGTHAQIVRHNLLMIVAAAATSVLLLATLVLIFLAGQSTWTRRSSNKNTVMCPGSTGKLPNSFKTGDSDADGLKDLRRSSPSTASTWSGSDTS